MGVCVQRREGPRGRGLTRAAGTPCDGVCACVCARVPHLVSKQCSLSQREQKSLTWPSTHRTRTPSPASSSKLTEVYESTLSHYDAQNMEWEALRGAWRDPSIHSRTLGRRPGLQGQGEGAPLPLTCPCVGRMRSQTSVSKCLLRTPGHSTHHTEASPTGGKDERTCALIEVRLAVIAQPEPVEPPLLPVAPRELQAPTPLQRSDLAPHDTWFGPLSA